jgi:hypothetical protein
MLYHNFYCILSCYLPLAKLGLRQKPQKRRNGDTPIGYLGRAALRREQCDVMPESQNRPFARKRFGKHCLKAGIAINRRKSIC